MSRDEMLACPFCGGPAECENLVFEAVIRCRGCYATLTRAHEAKADTGINEVFKAWNTRLSASLPDSSEQTKSADGPHSNEQSAQGLSRATGGEA